MPELPDVEFIKQRLEGVLIGAQIVEASSHDRRLLRPHAPVAFGRALIGRRVSDVVRRGKWLMIALGDGRLFSHLGMTGWWVVREVANAAERFERARIDVARGRSRASLRYVDARRFGRLVVTSDFPEWDALGPDPLADGIDVDRLADFARSRRAIKDIVMDQRVLAGIGNILATEAFWHARIDPRAPSDTLSRKQLAAIARALRDEIRRELSTRAKATGDEWQDVLAIYGRTGEPCPRCRTTISRAVIAGRTTAFCPRCQVTGSPRPR